MFCLIIILQHRLLHREEYLGTMMDHRECVTELGLTMTLYWYAAKQSARGSYVSVYARVCLFVCVCSCACMSVLVRLCV